MSDIKFSDKLSALCAMELADAHGDADRIGEMIERLCNSLSFTISIAARGDATATDTLLTGATGYLYEASASHQKIGAFMSRHGRKR